MAKHIANRVEDMCGNVEERSYNNRGELQGSCNVLDGFCGVGGNLISFARKCGFCVGSDMDP